MMMMMRAIKTKDVESYIRKITMNTIYGSISKVLHPDNRTLKHKIFDTLTQGIAGRLDIQRRELSIEFRDEKLYVYYDDTILREWNGEHPYMECFFENTEGYGIYLYIPLEIRNILRPLLDGSTPDYFNEVMEYYHAL